MDIYSPSRPPFVREVAASVDAPSRRSPPRASLTRTDALMTQRATFRQAQRGPAPWLAARELLPSWPFDSN